MNDIVLIFLTTWLSLGVKAKTLKTIEWASGVCDVFSHLIVQLKVTVVLRHVLQRRLLQTAAQEPRDQTHHKHADVRDEHSDAVPGVCTSDAAARQTHSH